MSADASQCVLVKVIYIQTALSLFCLLGLRQTGYSSAFCRLLDDSVLDDIQYHFIVLAENQYLFGNRYVDRFAPF